jgi:hypothetical protein
VLETAPRPADAIYAVPSRRVDGGSRRVSELTLASLAFALTVCLLGGAWLGGSHFLGIHRTVVLGVSKQGAEPGHPTPNTTEDVHDQQADLGGMRAAQSLNTEDVAGLGNTKPRPDAAKTETASSGIADVSDKVAYSGSKSADNLPKVGWQPDRIGLEIAALHAAAPVADRSLSPASVVPRTQRKRGDAFDPSKNPNAPGAPRPLGTIARTTTANSASASNQRQTASSPSL